MKVKIIAEIGVNHNSNMTLAKKMIKSASECGADIIKFQIATPELVQTVNAPKAKYQIKNSQNKDESQLEMIRKLHFNHESYYELKKEVEKMGKQFMASAFDLESLKFLKQLGEFDHKIPSGEITNLPFLREISKIAKSVILSTGMSNLNEVRDALNVLIEGGLKKSKITLLHCNTEYPTPMSDVNLNAMQKMGNIFEVNYGYSDHTVGIEIPIAAVAIGATVIEKHFTIDKTLPGPDQTASLDPHEFKKMVHAIRNIEKALGSDQKQPSDSELNNINIVRRSIYSSCDIKKGDTFNLNNLVMLRPANGVSPMEIDLFLNKKSIRDIKKMSIISKTDIEK